MEKLRGMEGGGGIAVERGATTSNGNRHGASGGGPRPLRRRSSLPNSRAVVGGFLVALSALLIFAAYTGATGDHHTRFVVAARDLTPGRRLTGADLTTAPMTLSPQLARAGAFTDPRRLVGATLVGPLRRGELVQAGAVVRLTGDKGSVEVAFAIDPARAVAGSLGPGDRVDVVATFGTGADAYTVAVVSDAEVVSVAGGRGGLGEGRNQTVTLAVAGRTDALAISHALHAGEVTLVRTTGALPAGDTGVYRAPRP